MPDINLFKYILIPFDGSVSSRRAIDVGLGMSQAFGAKVSLVTVEEYLPRFAGDIGEVKEEQERQNEYCARIQREAREFGEAAEPGLRTVRHLCGPRGTIYHHPCQSDPV